MTDLVLEPISDPEHVWEKLDDDQLGVLDHYYISRFELAKSYIPRKEHEAQLASIKAQIEKQQQDAQSMGFLSFLMSLL